MSNLTSEQKESLIEQVEQLIVMGFTKPSQIIKQGIVQNKESAKDYIAIAQRRLRNRYKGLDRSKLIARETKSLDLMEKKCWAEYAKAQPMLKTKIMQNIVMIQKRRAELLGIDAPKANLNLNLNQDGKAHNTATPDDVDHVINAFNRIKAEVGDQQDTGKGSEEKAGAEKPAELRPDLPAPLPVEPSPAVPPGTDTVTVPASAPPSSGGAA